MNAYAQRVLENLKNAAPWETEFLQSVTEVFESLGKILDVNPKYEKNKRVVDLPLLFFFLVCIVLCIVLSNPLILSIENKSKISIHIRNREHF